MFGMHNDLSRARYYLRRGRHGMVMNLLAPQVFVYRRNAEFFFLLAYACYRAADYPGAWSYLKRGEDLAPDNVDIQLLLALLCLIRNDLSASLGIWISLLDKDPSNIRARTGMDLLKAAPEQTDWKSLASAGKLRDLEPRLAWSLPVMTSGTLRYLAVGAGLLIALVAGVAIALSLVQNLNVRKGSDLIDSASKDFSTVPSGGVALVELSREEISASLDRLRRSFRDYDDNKARIEINRLLGASIDQATRNQVEMLKTHLKTPQFTNFKTSFSIREVRADLALHEGVHVMWKGRVADVVRLQERMTFNLLVGYEGNQVVEGTVPVELTFPVDLSGGEAVELIGRVIVDRKSNDGMKLEASSLRLIGPARD